SSEESQILSNLNSDSLFDRKKYETEYINWAERFASKAELMIQHNTDFLNFIDKNEQTLQDTTNVNTVKVKTSIRDLNSKLKRSIEGVNGNLKTFEEEAQKSKAIQDLLLIGLA
ncbi:MAG: hypothetical protein AB1468_06560, partial [Candidatus Micrarchaeota archaeon]